MTDPIFIVPYDPNWPALFKDEARNIKRVLGPNTMVEHFGSTSVPGLGAKPVIDILVGITAGPFDAERLRELGYVRRRDNASWWTFLRKGRPRTHHLHVIDVSQAEGRAHWLKALAFRDALRTSPDIRSQYEQLKRELADRFKNDRPAYEAGKTDFIVSVLSRLTDQ